MKKYAGSYADKYADKYASDYDKYSDYQKYMKRYQDMHHEVRNAHDAKNKAQLKEWEDQSKQNVQWYVPDEDVKHADKQIDKSYQTHLVALESSAESTTKAPASSGPFEVSDQNAFQMFLAAEESQVKSDALPCAAMSLLGAAFACLVFFAVRSRRTIQKP